MSSLANQAALVEQTAPCLRVPGQHGPADIHLVTCKPLYDSEPCEGRL